MVNPYGHVPIPTDEDDVPKSIVDTPVFHDGQRSKGLVSGELRCTLTALTPLIVANDQLEAKDVEGAHSVEDGKVTLPESWRVPCPVAADKKIVEPLRDQTKQGRVLIQGPSIKGMIEASLGALLCAPMARVEERTFSYRPNLEIPGPNDALRRQPRAAIVVGRNADTGLLSLLILPTGAFTQVAFIQSSVAAGLSSSPPGGLQTGSLKNTDIKNLPGGRKRFIYTSGRSASIDNYRYYKYFGGIDTQGHLAAGFRPGGRVYEHVLIPDSAIPKPGTPGYQTLDVGADVFEQHRRTHEHLKDDQQGHLRSEHPLTGKIDVCEVAGAIGRSTSNIETPGALIYVEVELNAANQPVKIVSLGQNFRYRWRYSDSVRTRWTPAGTKQRKLLVPHPKERQLSGEGKHRAPTMLTGARLITGYAVNKRNLDEMGLGEGDFTQLAGRIAINFAVEHLADGKTMKQRFLSERGNYVVPLKVLGMPRASAEVEYLRQPHSPSAVRGDMGKYLSYGDVLGEKSGELAGRKFYRHQPNARTQYNLFRGSHTPDGQHDTENLANKQSKFARFVSQPGTRFRFTLRFRDLRHWELGAVLVCLRPTLLQDREAALATPDQQSPSHAVKLGQGRPLGLGSVRIDIDRVIDIDTLLGDDQQDASNEDRLARASLSAFAEKVGNAGQEARDEWLDLHRYADAKPAAYPTAQDKDGEHHIYQHYTNLRRDHSKGRRRR